MNLLLKKVSAQHSPLNFTMNMTYIFCLEDHADADLAWQQLETLGWQPLYATEDDNGSQQIVTKASDPSSCPSLSISSYSGVVAIQPYELPPIDWQEQWSCHSQFYRDGLLYCDLALFGPSDREPLILEPGPGFGDLSHPTTRLVLRMMASHVQGNVVVDVGCGSGILSLAAARWGASHVWAIDICPEAITHTKTNAEKNNLQDIIVCIDSSTTATLPELSKDDNLIIVMNMIASEQQDALASLPQLLVQPNTQWIVSGILAEQQAAYLEACAAHGWLPQEIVEEDGWLGIHFKSSQKEQ